MPSMPPERQREETLEALVALLLEMSEREPVILLVEDLHWLDATTLTWLERLIDQTATAPLLLVMTIRPNTLDIPWGSRARVTQIALEALSSDETERLIRLLTGGADAPSAGAAAHRRQDRRRSAVRRGADPHGARSGRFGRLARAADHAARLADRAPGPPGDGQGSGAAWLGHRPRVLAEAACRGQLRTASIRSSASCGGWFSRGWSIGAASARRRATRSSTP